MNQRQAKAILQELNRRKLNRPKWLNRNFIKQNAFINDPATLKAVQCTRRAGKSYGGGLYAFKEAFENPGVSVVIIGLTRDSVKRIFFKDILTVINNKYNLKASPNRSDLTFTLPNKSVIYLLGIDSNPDDMNKLLGQKNRLVIIDEAAFFRQNMKKLIFEILRPSMIDHDGTIALLSTTSHLTKSFYFDVTNGRKLDWSVHKWTAEDNPFIKDKWQKEVKSLKKNNPGIENTPMYRRMYNNEWVIDEDMLVYKYDVGNNINVLPTDHKWSYVLGIDLGYNDDTAFVVCAYSEYDHNLYIVDTFKKSGMIVEEVADKINLFNKKYNFDTMVIDNASKQVVEELKQRYNLPLIPAEKTDKRGYIEMMNSDMATNKIKLLPNAAPLHTEWESLIWDEKALDKGKYVEHPSCDNHLSDAALYAWRYVYNYNASTRPRLIRPGTQEQVEQFWEQEAEAINNPVEDWLDTAY